MLVLTVCAAWLVLVRCSNLQEPFMLAGKVKIMAMASGRSGGHSILAPPADFKFHPDKDLDENIDADANTDSDILLLFNDEDSEVIENNETEENRIKSGSIVLNTKLNKDNISNSNNATTSNIINNATTSNIITNATTSNNINNATTSNIINNATTSNNSISINNATVSDNMTTSGSVVNITNTDHIAKNNGTNSIVTTAANNDASDNVDNSDDSDSLTDPLEEQTKVPTTDNPVDAQTMSTPASDDGVPPLQQSVPWYSAVQRYPGAQEPAFYGASAVMWSPIMFVLQPVVVPAQYIYSQPQILRPVQSSMKELPQPVQFKAQESQRSQQEFNSQKLQRPVELQYPSINANLVGLQGWMQPYYRFV